MKWTFHVVIIKMSSGIPAVHFSMTESSPCKDGPQAASSLYFNGQQYKEFLNHEVTLF
jgi:hypothetical protein